MHIVLGALGSVITILWLLHRLAEMGIDLGGLNPWLWQRRRRWRQKYEGNPIYSLESPMEVTALLIAGTAKVDGDMSVEEKAEILGVFENEFSLSKRDAADLLLSVTHLLGRGDEFYQKLAAVLAPSKERFTQEQAESAIELMQRVAAISSTGSQIKSELIESARSALIATNSEKGKWE